MSMKSYYKGSLNPIHFFRSIHFDSEFYQKNPNYFEPDGIHIFCGPQGSGKTLSAVKFVKKLLKAYPHALICSNLAIKGLDREIIPFTDYDQLQTLSNGLEGIIFLIDEIHVLWNSLESKNIPVSEMAVFCQMRKERRMIVGTSQVYGRIAKPIREQLKTVCICKNYLKYLQVNTVIDPNDIPLAGADQNDGKLDGSVQFRVFFFHTPEDYRSYETLNKIERIERGVKK